jgi:LPXTG-motif cell wall-anchored protein
MKRQIRGVLTAAGLLLAVLVPTAPAVAQYPPPPPPSQDEAAGPATVQPGESPVFQADGFEAETVVAIRAFSQAGAQAMALAPGINAAPLLAQDGGAPLAVSDTARAGSAGVVTYELAVPCGTAAGPATIEFTGEGEDGEPRTVSTDFTIVDDPAAVCPAGDGDLAGAPADDDGLATTGGQISNGLVLAAVILAAGTGLVLTARRRRVSLRH